MRDESHAWLKWPGCTPARKIELNNKLAEMQNRALCQPRFLEGEVVTKLGIKNQLSKMFMTRIEGKEGVFEIPIWTKALNITEEVYREWCLEFYASLRVDKKFQSHEFHSKKLIHFRLGGKEHSVSVSEFGFLTGLLTEAESKDRRISGYLLAGKLSSKDFGPEADRAWLELTRLDKHSSASKVSAIRVPILRLVHKLLVYSFIHRVTQHDKCYLDDLWLLDTFNKRNPGNFVCVPWVLVNFMETRAAGKKKDSQICCGHFVTKIVRNLGLYTQANIKACTRPVDFKRITMHDLEVMKLLKPDHTGLIEETVAEGPAVPVRRPKGRQSILGALEELNKGNRELKQMVKCLSERLDYHIDRYRPVLEKLATADATTAGTSLAPYAPPAPFAPISADEDTEQEEEGSESGDEESSEEEAPEDEEDT